MRQRILFCANYYPPNFMGGAELTAHHQALALRDLGHEVAVFAGDPRGKGPRHNLVSDHWGGLKVWRVTLTSQDFGVDESSFYKKEIDDRFAALLDQLRPDIVHFHNLLGLSLGMVTRARRHGSKVFCTLHDHWGFCFKSTLLKPSGQTCFDSTRCFQCQSHISSAHGTQLPMRLRRDYIRYQLQRADGLISPSYYLAGAYIRAGMSASKFSVIPYGIDVEASSRRAKTSADGRLRVGFTGYIGEHKGPGVLIAAVAKARLQERLEVSIAGEGESLPSLEKMVRKQGLSSRIRFLGRLDNRGIRRLHESLDVLVVPSIWPENSPVTIYEAQASRTVVLASRVGGVPELVEHGRTGLLFQPGSSDELATLLDRLADDRPLVDRIARNAAESIAPVTLESAARRLEQLYARPTRSDEDRQSKRLVIALAGTPDPACLEALERVDASPRFESVCFLNTQWTHRESAQEADVVWIANRRFTHEDLTRFGLQEKPLIAPDSWMGGPTDRLLGRYSGSVDVRSILNRLISEEPSSLQALLPMTA